MIESWSTDETDPAARGNAFGAAWGERVRATLTEYEELFAGRNVGAATVQQLSEASREVVAEHAPEILAEIDGVAAGAGIAPWQAMALSARTEILARASVVTEECSTAVFIPADGRSPRTVQTWDWYSQMAHETVVRSQPAPDGARIVTFGEFGQVAKIGVSSRGLGVHFNILQHTTDGSQPGVPVHVLTRMILDRAGTLAQALEIVDSVPLGASTVLTVVTREPAAACVELSPAGWAAIRAVPGEPLLHTNHFLDPALAAGETPATAFSTTRERLAYLDGRGSAVEISDPLARVSALASEEPGSICVDPDTRRAPGDRPETKATFTIDVDRCELGFAPSHPRNIGAEQWRTATALVPA
ncbi:C45 family autoproteolytic acyltransferase/hydolase [Pseudactinotalea sp.]|uniref:C45 family autoproteolytic acyltransferase/hydolase n=1 Tax=Pseudactinotalea sp. TaxID=1926260 RepID=UPI003B3B7AAD